MRLTRLLNNFALALITIIITSPAYATLNLTGVEVQGELFINGGLENEFDPNNGEVPAGFGNSLASQGGTGEASAFISDSIVEFGYSGSGAQITANFTSTGMFQVNGASTLPTESVSLNFFSPAFTTQITAVTISGSGCSYGSNLVTGASILGPVGPQATLACSFNVMAGQGFSTTLQLRSVPEPASGLLFLVGLMGLRAIRRFRS
jgi:PEP-CTERM motif-containing protein